MAYNTKLAERIRQSLSLLKEIWAPTDGFIFNGGFRITIW